MKEALQHRPNRKPLSVAVSLLYNSPTLKSLVEVVTKIIKLSVYALRAQVHLLLFL